MARQPAAKQTKQNDLAAKAQPFLERIERLEAEKESEKGSYMERCHALNEDIKVVLGEAKDCGIVVKSLKGIIKQRKLQKKIDAIDDDFDMDEAAQFSALAEAFGDTPFGRHARARAAETKKTAEANGNPEATGGEQRPDEEHLAKIGRGPDGAESEPPPGAVLDSLVG